MRESLPKLDTAADYRRYLTPRRTRSDYILAANCLDISCDGTQTHLKNRVMRAVDALEYGEKSEASIRAAGRARKF